MINRLLLINYLCALILFSPPTFAEECIKQDNKNNPYILNYNCSFLNSSSFRAIIGFGDAWKQHLSAIKDFLSQDCLGIDKLVNEYVENKINNKLDDTKNIRGGISIDNSRAPSSTRKVIEEIYGK